MKVSYKNYTDVFELAKDGISTRDAFGILPITLPGTKSLLSMMVKNKFLRTTKHWENSTCFNTYWQEENGRELLYAYVEEKENKIKINQEKKEAYMEELKKRDAYKKMTNVQIEEAESKRKEKSYTVENSKHATATGYIVKGLDGFHSGKIERVRQKAYVGSTANII